MLNRSLSPAFISDFLQNKKEPDISVRLSRLILFHCHTTLLRGFPAIQGVLRYQLLNLRHNILHFTILPDGKGLVLLSGEAQGEVDLGDLLRRKKGVFLTSPLRVAKSRFASS